MIPLTGLPRTDKFIDTESAVEVTSGQEEMGTYCLMGTTQFLFERMIKF